jgi:NAD(P)-dependent dehydrogenase (short-subunit alcohol dehydrogenase family)
MDLQLGGKRALVTGGSRGIGKAIARQLAREGVECVICARTEAVLRAAAEEVAGETGGRIVPVVADLADAASIAALVERATTALGGIDILINNGARASGAIAEDLANLTDETILHDFEEKVVGYLRTARAVAPTMRAAGWGRIINISGLSARAAGGISAGARNAAVVNLTKALSLELGRSGVTVNAIYPAITLTEAVQERVAARARSQGVAAEELLRQAAAGNAIGRLVTADEIAYVAAFLASPLAAGVTGEALAVSGGAGTSVYY